MISIRFLNWFITVEFQNLQVWWFYIKKSDLPSTLEKKILGWLLELIFKINIMNIVIHDFWWRFHICLDFVDVKSGRLKCRVECFLISVSFFTTFLWLCIHTYTPAFFFIDILESVHSCIFFIDIWESVHLFFASLGCIRCKN